MDKIGDIARAVHALRQGEAVVFPTDTVYGLGVSSAHAKSPGLLYDLKGRDHEKPVAWLVADTEALDAYGEELPKYVHTLARAFWPGALTLVVKANEKVPCAFRSKEGTIALRMPDDPMALGLLEALDTPIATTSANLSGQKAPVRFSELDSKLLAAVSVALRGEAAGSGRSSTVLDCTGAHPQILRRGSLSESDIERYTFYDSEGRPRFVAGDKDVEEGVL